MRKPSPSVQVASGAGGGDGGGAGAGSWARARAMMPARTSVTTLMRGKLTTLSVARLSARRRRSQSCARLTARQDVPHGGARRPSLAPVGGRSSFASSASRYVIYEGQALDVRHLHARWHRG